MRQDQRGLSMAPFMAAIVVSILLLIGLVVDGGAQASAVRRAERLAGRTPDFGAAIAKARQVVAEEPNVTAEVTFSGGRVRVVTTTWTDTAVLSLIGITRLAADGSAEAELVADR